MLLLRPCLAAVALNCIGALALAQSVPPVLEGTLDFSSTEGEDRAADMLFEQVKQHSGEIVELKLKIVPGADADSKGYSLRRMRSEEGGSDSDAALEVVCETGVGFVENVAEPFEMTFNHTRNFHSPTTVVIGPRLSFPHQSAKCLAEGANEAGLTPLELSGFYLVDTVTIPTANESMFIPVNP